MINSYFKSLLGSVISFVIAYLCYSRLSPYMLSTRNDLSSILKTALEVIDASLIYKAQILLTILSAVAAIALCCCIIIYLGNELSNKSLTHIKRLLIIVWITLLIMNIVFLIYSLFSLVIIIILFIITVLILGAITVGAMSGSPGIRGSQNYISSERGGPVHVRGHYRNGSYVRSHTRKRPRHF